MSKKSGFLGHRAFYALIYGLFAFFCVVMSVVAPRAQAFLQNQAPLTDGFWQFIDESSLVAKGERQIIPQTYRLAQVNEEGFRQALGKAPLEFTEEAKTNSLTVALPMPDGSFASFRIEESPIMQAPLAAQYPDIKTYRGQGLDDPAATIRFDFTPAGFHAIVLSERGTVYIDPYSKNDTEN